MTRPESKPCVNCGRTMTPYLAEAINRWIFPACECRSRARNTVEDRLRREERTSRKRTLMPYKIPARYKGALMSNVFPETKLQKEAKDSFERFIRTFDKRLVDGLGAYVYGVPGTGKTYLAAAVGNELDRMGYHIVYEEATQIVNRLKANSRNLSGLIEHELVRLYGEVDLLIVDDLGKEAGWETEIARLHAVINERSKNLKPTIITTEMDPGALAHHLGRHGDGFMSRLSETMTVFEFDGEDRRPRQQRSW